MIEKRALIRMSALLAQCNLRLGTGYCLLCLFYPERNGWHDFTHRLRQVFFNQQAVVTVVARIDELPVDMGQRDAVQGMA